VKTQELVAKSVQAVASAKLLLDVGDTDGASNRAYYAMFDAARAALPASGYEAVKTHRGVLNAFSDRLVKNGPLPKEMVHILKYAETFRYVADYEEVSVELSKAREMVRQAETFVALMQSEFMPEESDDNHHGIGP
jgi:uncharacterized protein (UPF0332 family)